MDYYVGRGRNAALTCRYFGISRQTFYRWRKRYDPKRLQSLEDRSRRSRRVRQPTWSAELAAERGIRPGRAVTSEELVELADADARRRAMDAAVRLLSYGPRSVHELRDRLKRKSFEPEIIAVTVDRLKELGYVDDEAFARSWTESRQSSRPRSARLVASELRLKGIEPQVANGGYVRHL